MNKIYLIAILGALGGSVWYGVQGLKKLIKWKMWRQIAFLLVFLFGYPCIIKFVYQIEDENVRLWAAIPTVLVSFCWIFSGFFLAHFTEKWQALNDRRGEKMGQVRDPARELGGLIMIVIGAGIWYFGATHPGMAKIWEKLLMVSSMFSLFFGLTRVIKSRWWM